MSINLPNWSNKLVYGWA